MAVYSVLFLFCILFESQLVNSDVAGAYEFADNPEWYTWFYLYPSFGYEYAQVLPLFNGEVLKSSFFDRNLPTRILVHGFKGSKDSECNQYVLSAYLSRGGFNVIVVDWSHGVTLEDRYIGLGVVNTPRVGKVIAMFLDFLSAVLNYPLGNVNIIGYSLGAHAAGFAGKYLRRGQLGAIVALDPPGQILLNDTERRLAPNDAFYVEVIHTNFLGYGSLPPMGHADFYANGGGLQPGCSFRNTMCSHQRAYKIFAESILNPFGFPAKRCVSLMRATGIIPCAGDESIYYVGGEPLRYHQRGLFFFLTAIIRD